ncbi:MAG: DUF2066 domain-containing protein [Gammaproteobacteria bacterium]|nr:DUF2066 domain-containing protein [Gammaproteobacteria bacterium]
MPRLSSALFLLLCACAPVAHAVRVSGLYETEVSILDRSAASRKAALSTALGVVIAKVTGNRNAAESPALLPILRLAESYVQQDQYRESAPTSAGGTGQLKLWARFDETTLNSDLRQLGLPVWDLERPSILIWLVASDGTARGFVAPDDLTQYMTPVEERARARGLVIEFPLFDLQDAAGLQAGDIGGGPNDAVFEASRRYQADSILAGNVESAAPGIWEGRWTAYIGGETATWTGEGGMPETVIEEGIDEMADRLAARYAQRGSAAEAADLDITVSDVNTVDDYARTLKYLASLNSVAAVQVTRVEPGEVSFTVRVHGGEPALVQALFFGSTLEPSGGEGGQYRLLP